MGAVAGNIAVGDGPALRLDSDHTRVPRVEDFTGRFVGHDVLVVDRVRGHAGDIGPIIPHAPLVFVGDVAGEGGALLIDGHLAAGVLRQVSCGRRGCAPQFILVFFREVQPSHEVEAGHRGGLADPIELVGRWNIRHLHIRTRDTGAVASTTEEDDEEEGVRKAVVTGSQFVQRVHNFSIFRPLSGPLSVAG